MCSPTSAHGYSDLVGVRTRILYKLICGPPADSSWSTICYCTWQSTMHRTMLSCQVSHISLTKSIRDHSNIYNPRLERHNQGLSIIDFFAILCLWLLEEPSFSHPYIISDSDYNYRRIMAGHTTHKLPSCGCGQYPRGSGKKHYVHYL